MVSETDHMNATMLEPKPLPDPSDKEQPIEVEIPPILPSKSCAPIWMLGIFKDHIKTLNRWKEARIRLAMIKIELDWELEELNEKFETSFSIKDFAQLNEVEMDKAYERLASQDEET